MYVLKFLSKIIIFEKYYVWKKEIVKKMMFEEIRKCVLIGENLVWKKT